MSYIKPKLSQGVCASGSSTPTGAVPQKTTMSELETSVATVGHVGQLVNSSGAIILTCIRVAAGANGLVPVGRIDLWRASSGSFDGSYAPYSVNSVGTISWGTNTARTTGGISVTTGTVIFPGWAKGYGISRYVRAVAYISALPGTPAAGDCVLASCLPTGSTTTDMYGGGFAHNGTSYRAVGCANGAPNGPGLGYGSSLVSTPTVPDFFELSASITKSSNAADNAAISGTFSTAHPNIGGSPYSATLTSLDSSVNTFDLGLTVVGGWTVRFTELWHNLRISSLT